MSRHLCVRYGDTWVIGTGKPITIAGGNYPLYKSALCICGVPELCIFAKFEAFHVDLGARRIGVPVGKIATRKTWIYECVVRSSSMCVQVAREYRLEGHCHAPTGQFGMQGSCSARRGGCNTRLKVGKSKNGGYDRESNQRCKGPHCAESKFDARRLGPHPDMTRGNQIARTDEGTFPSTCNLFAY